MYHSFTGNKEQPSPAGSRANNNPGSPLASSTAPSPSLAYQSVFANTLSREQNGNRNGSTYDNNDQQEYDLEKR